jgi:hypothetical protein
VRDSQNDFLRTTANLPFHTGCTKELTLNQTPIITVTGKAFFALGQSLKEQKLNRRSHAPDHATSGIHPVMKIDLSNHGDRFVKSL